jgi:ketosteroid isomerase-like protein
MTSTEVSQPSIANRLRSALTSRDIEAFGALLSDDVQWGDGDNPRACHNRADVIATLTRALLTGADGTLVDLQSGKKGIFCQFKVTPPRSELQSEDRDVYHVYHVKDDQIYLIRSFEDRTSAAKSAGIK